MSDRALPEYNCVADVSVEQSPVYGEVTTVTFDRDGDWIYRELLDRIEDDGYDLVGFGVGSGGQPKASFVYRG